MSGLRYAISDTLVLAYRNFLRIPRAPDLLIAFTVQPIMFVLLFAYVFGGAIPTPGQSYIDFLIPGILVRFRSLPMSRAAVLAGRTLADIATNTISITVMLVVGVIIGFGFSTSFLEIVAGILLLLLFGYAFSWVFAWIGLVSSSPEAAQSVGFIVIFPLTFVSSAFVPPETMPAALQWFAEWNPFSITVNAVPPSSSATPPATPSGAPSPGPSASPSSSPCWRSGSTNAPWSVSGRGARPLSGTGLLAPPPGVR